MGVPVRIEGDRLIVPGVDKLKPPTQPLDSHGDHRLAMTARLALAAAGIDAPILREEAASVSYPGFHRDLESLLK
jgi:3-phosphoshikimate 1-carboxyvinyltransferase